MGRVPCEAEGRFKVARDGSTSRLFCEGHASEWQKRFGGRRVEPRKTDSTVYPCAGDWLLAGMVW